MYMFPCIYNVFDLMTLNTQKLLRLLQLLSIFYSKSNMYTPSGECFHSVTYIEMPLSFLADHRKTNINCIIFESWKCSIYISQFHQYPSPPPGNCGAFAHIVLCFLAFAISPRPRGWVFVYVVVIPGHLTHMFSKVPWRNSLAKTRHLLGIG